MWAYQKKLQYPINIKNKDLKMAKFLLEQYGGGNSELAAALRYLNQRFTMPDDRGKALLTDIGTEELVHTRYSKRSIDMNNLKCLKQGFNKYVCKHTNNEIKFSQCKNCPYKEYKERKVSKIKQRTSKQSKLERNRASLFTDDLDHCIVCGKEKEHLHEVYSGAYRIRSIKEHMVLPLCSFHHRLIHDDLKLSLYWKQLGQKIFEKYYSRDEFLKMFGKNYRK